MLKSSLLLSEATTVRLMRAMMVGLKTISFRRKHLISVILYIHCCEKILYQTNMVKIMPDTQNIVFKFGRYK